MAQITNTVLAGSGVPPLPNPILSPLPPRYRLRDLILGDYAYADDGERYGLSYFDIWPAPAFTLSIG